MSKKIVAILTTMALMITMAIPVMAAGGDNMAEDIFGLNVAFSTEKNGGADSVFYKETESANAATGKQIVFFANVFVGNDADKLVNVKREVKLTSDKGVSKLEIKDTDNKWKSAADYNKSVIAKMDKNQFPEIHITFKKSGNYTLSYSLYDANNKTIITRTLAITVTGKDIPDETTTKKPTATPTTKTSTGTKTIKVGSETVKIGGTKVKKATKVKNSKKAKITLKKVKDIQGYQIQFSTTKKFKKVLVKKTVKKYNVTVKSKKLKGKKTLYVRARAYKKVNKKTYYGNWSAVKKVTIKK